MNIDNMIFVFGSNLAGRHGAGAALYALKHKGAVFGTGEGMQGYSYGIPTKDMRLRTMPLFMIEPHVREFISFAEMNQDLQFQVTRIGCGLAGYQDEEMAPFFEEAPGNCFFDTKWMAHLGQGHRFWGTF